MLRWTNLAVHLEGDHGPHSEQDEEPQRQEVVQHVDADGEHREHQNVRILLPVRLHHLTRHAILFTVQQGARWQPVKRLLGSLKK